MSEYQKKSIFAIIVALIAIIIILALAYALYYFAVQPIPQVVQPAPLVKNNNQQVNQNPKVQSIPTEVITFTAPTNLPKNQQSGNCFSSSIAEPFRKDAYRCMIKNSIYDPCFTTKQKDLIFCPINPLTSNSIVIKLNKALPKPEAQTEQDNWAWFLTLEDGTVCSPFTGTRPFFNEGKDIAYYGCESKDKTKQILILGDLIKDTTWKANEAILTQTGNNWNITSTQQVNISKIWQ